MGFTSCLRKYNVEPILFLYQVGRNLYFPTPYTQLITDKICLNNYNFDYVFCRHINDDGFKDTQNATLVFGDTVNYVMYGQMILSIPSILAAIFLGPWLDMHCIAPKIVLLFTLCATFFETFIQLLNVVFFNANAILILISHILNGITGGYMLFMTAIFTFAMKETPLADRTFRFTIIEFAMVLPNPIANYISSLILPQDPWLIEDQTRNYLPIYVIGSSIYLFCMIYTLIFLGEVKEVTSPNDNILKRASLRTSLQPLGSDYLLIKNDPVLQHYTNTAYERDADEKDFKLNLEQTNKQNRDDNNNNFLGGNLKDQKKRAASLHQSLPVINSNNATKGEMFKSLFQLKNATAMIKSTVKRREEKAHYLLWLTLSIYVLLLVFSNGIPLIMLPFAQKVYAFSPAEYMQIDSIGHLGYGLVSTFCLLLFHKIELRDPIVIIIGLISMLTINLLRGAFLNPIALYISYATGSVYLVAVVACRGFVAKIVPENEIGTVLGVMSVFYATSPVLASLFYTQIYRLSLNYNPGLAFIVGTFGSLVAVLCAICLHIRFNKYKEIMESKNVDEPS